MTSLQTSNIVIDLHLKSIALLIGGALGYFNARKAFIKISGPEQQINKVRSVK